MFSNFDNGLGQASRDYEEWLYNPERGTKSSEDYEREAEEKEEALTAIGEAMFEDARVAEMDEDLLWNV